MAIELDGKPLKFTAEFDSREAEQSLDSFLKKIQDVNTRGAGNTSAQRAASKASGQYKSILDDATTAFDAFANKSKYFYAEIAKAEIALQKIRNEQNQLNKEFRDGITTEQDHINKTAQLNALRDQLSEKIRSNKAELKSFADEAKKQTTPKFTTQDTLNELAGAHGAGNAPALPSLSVNEAFAKANKQAIADLNLELDELNKKLKAGSITNEQYAKSSKSIGDKLEALNENQRHFADHVGKSGQAVETEGQKQKNILDTLSSEYKQLLQDATSAYSDIDSRTRYLTASLLKLETESKDITAAQKEVTAAFKNGDITQREYTNSIKALMVQQNAVKGRIADVKKELSSLETVERKTIGSIAEKTAKLTQLKLQYDNLSQSQRNNINVGGKLRKEYQELVKEVERLNRALNGTKGQNISSLLTSVRGIAGAVGITFSVQQLAAFGRELYDIARQAEGIELRFAKIGDTRGLEKLRAATRGTVSDLELMKLAVNADNFRIPMDVLAKGLEFATRRATETGQSVDYLVNSFVTGLGRKSKLILDNLGISAVELNDEISRTGDFASSVGNIIDREMAKSGNAVDGLTEKTNRLSVTWANFKKNLAQGIADFFVPGRPDADNVEKLTEAYKNSFEAIKSYSDDARKRFIENSQKQLSEVNKNIQNLTIESPEFKKLYEDSKRSRSTLKFETQENYLARLQKPLIEQQQAIQATLAYARGVTNEMAIQARQAKGVFSMAEVQEKLDDANLVYKNSVGAAKRAEAKKEVDKWQKLYDDMNLKAAKKQDSAADRLRKQIQRDEDERVKLLDGWAKTDADYLNKQLSRDQQEVESVKNKYADMRKAIEKYNRDTKAKRISFDGLDASMQNSIAAVKDRQATDRRIKLYQEDYQNYAKFESLKISLGEEVATAQYGKYKDVLDRMSVEYGALVNKMLSIGINPNEASLMKYLGEQLSDVRSRQKEEFVDALSSIRTYNERRLDAEREYQRKYQVLEREAIKRGQRVSEEQKARLKEELNRELLAITEEQINDNPAFANLDSRIEGITSKLAKDAIKLGRSTVNGIIDGLKQQYPDLINELNELEKIINKQLDDADTTVASKDYSQIEGMVAAFDTLIQQANQFDGRMSSILKTISQMVGGIASMSQGLGSAMKSAGPSLGAFAAVLGVLGTLTEIGEASNQRKQQEYLDKTNYSYERQLKQMEGITSILEYQLSLVSDIYGVDRITSYERVRQNAANAIKDSLGYFDGRDFNPDDPKADNNSLELLRGRMDGKKYQLTGNADYDRIIEGINKGQDVMKMYGNTRNRLRKLLDDYEKMIEEGLLIPVEIGFTDVSKITTEEIQRLNELVRSNTLDEGTKEQVQNIIDQYDLWKEATNQLREELLGISFQGVLDLTTDLFFNSGEDSADAWQKGFDSVMKDYLKNLFSREFLEGAVQEFYDLYDQLSQGGLTDDEKKILQDKWAQIEKDGKDRLESYQDDLGLDFSNDSSSSSSVAGESIARQLTESTGTEIVGMYRAGYDIWKRQLNTMELQSKTQASLLQVANDKLLVLNSININTANTVLRLDTAVKHLQNIDKNLGGRNAG